MLPLPPPSLSWPRRVSRLYPLFSLVLLITSSILFYAWQSTLLDINSLAKVEERNKTLQDQISSLTSAQKLDRARLTIQDQKITQATSQLAAVQKELKATSDQLATKDKQLRDAQDQLKKQQDQLSQNASELEQLRSRPPLFSFQNNSSVDNFEQKRDDLKKVISAAFNTIQDLYGKPYLLNSIAVTFVNSFSISGSAGEIIIENSSQGIKINIHLKDFDKSSFQDNNTVIHEMVHGFHGIAVLNSSALEEGMTVATTDAVMAKMVAAGSLPQFSHLYLTISDEQYQQWNDSLRIPADNQAFYSSPDVAKIYQVIGKAWYTLYQQDPAVFQKINANYYPKVQKGLTPDNPLVLDAIRSAISTVNGQSIDTYLTANRAFYPN